MGQIGGLMKFWLFPLCAMLAIVLVTGRKEITAQSNATRFEVGGQFTGIRADNSPGSTFFTGRPGDRLDVGGGGRFSFNLHRYVDLESELNFFREKETFTSGATQVKLEGTKIEGLFGAKAGIRRDRFGVFAKVSLMKRDMSKLVLALRPQGVARN
jgi:hypothetical protein